MNLVLALCTSVLVLGLVSASAATSFMREPTTEVQLLSCLASSGYDVASLTDDDFETLATAVARYGDSECARLLVYHFEYDEASAAFEAMEAENAKTFKVFKRTPEARMTMLNEYARVFKALTLTDLYYSQGYSYEIKKIAKIIKMCPELAGKLEERQLLVACALGGTPEELKFLHQNCPNLPVTDETRWVFISLLGKYRSQVLKADESETVDYMARSMFSEPDDILQALNHASLYRSFGKPFLTLVKAAIETGVLDRCDPRMIVGSAARALDYAFADDNDRLKEVAITLLMNPKLSFEERLECITAEGFPTDSPTVLRLNAQQKANLLSSSTRPLFKTPHSLVRDLECSFQH